MKKQSSLANIQGIIDAKGFHAKNPPGTLLNIRFDVERLSSRLMHRAVDSTPLDLVWPVEIGKEIHGPAGDRAQIEAAAERLEVPKEMSTQQRFVIASLLARSHGKAPYLLFGPFGTGKTRTLTEYLRLLLAASFAPGGTPVRLLVCSPSNSSADNYVTSLAQLLGAPLAGAPTSGRGGGGSGPTGKILRILAPHRTERGLHPKVRPHTKFNRSTEQFELPPLEELAGFSLVVSTTRSAAMLASAGLPQGHFTHIIVDEAAQLMEAEALLPLSLAGPDTAVVMAGDPKQLGPTTFSKVDSVHGLHCSVMERLQLLPLYQHDTSHRASMHLHHNYRSHPELVPLSQKRMLPGIHRDRARLNLPDVSAQYPSA